MGVAWYSIALYTCGARCPCLRAYCDVLTCRAYPTQGYAREGYRAGRACEGRADDARDRMMRQGGRDITL